MPPPFGPAVTRSLRQMQAFALRRLRHLRERVRAQARWRGAQQAPVREQGYNSWRERKRVHDREALHRERERIALWRRAGIGVKVKKKHRHGERARMHEGRQGQCKGSRGKTRRQATAGSVEMVHPHLFHRPLPSSPSLREAHAGMGLGSAPKGAGLSSPASRSWVRTLLVPTWVSCCLRIGADGARAAGPLLHTVGLSEPPPHQWSVAAPPPPRASGLHVFSSCHPRFERCLGCKTETNTSAGAGCAEHRALRTHSHRRSNAQDAKPRTRLSSPPR